MQSCEAFDETLDFVLINKCFAEGPIVDMVRVEGGTFQMGDSIYRKELIMDGCNIEKYEKNVHPVTLNNFYIGKYEVTILEWRQLMDIKPSNLKYFREDSRPIYGISWYDAITFCNKLSNWHCLDEYYIIDSTKIDPFNKSTTDTIRWKVDINIEANGYRLPTEAEWEYAARGGINSVETIYAGSDSADEVAQFSKVDLEPVGKKKANELGIYDMSGNIAEWCYDWWDADYPKSEVINPLGPSVGSHRVYRGGAWGIGSSTVLCQMGPESDLRNITVFTRAHHPQENRPFTIGFRIARNIGN